MTAKEKIADILKKIDVEIGGSRPTDVKVHDERTYNRILGGGTLAIGESFMDGWWEVEDLAEVINRLHRTKVYEELVSFDALPLLIKGFFGNLQNRARSFMVGEGHYDLGNDLYMKMLDKRMVYTSGMWEGVNTLEEAQEQKLEMFCQKLGLKPGDRVLDIGCGWGSFMKYAVEKYQVTCVGLTVSVEQAKLGRKLCEGLPIKFVVQDYRNYKDEQKFDHIVSIEMIEAVGPKNFRTYFKKAHELLEPAGLFAIQAIGALDAKPVPSVWLDKYIFPNGVLPSLPQLEAASRKLFRFEHLENIGPDYDPTLMEWWRRFDEAYGELSRANPKYDERFYRMWKFYLQSCAGLFRAREGQDWQIVFSPITRS